MNDVVDAVLDDYRICAGYFYLPWKSGGTFQSVGIIRDIVVLPQNACAAGGFPNNCGSAVSIFQHSLYQIVWPCLCGNGIAKADDSAIFLIRQNFNIT